MAAGPPPALRLPLGSLGLPGSFGATDHDFIAYLRMGAVSAFVTAPGAPAATLPQQAVGAALAARAGVPLHAQQDAANFAGLQAWPGRGSAAYAAAQRLAALPPAAFRAWLAAHLAALRAGTLMLADLP